MANIQFVDDAIGHNMFTSSMPSYIDFGWTRLTALNTPLNSFGVNGGTLDIVNVRFVDFFVTFDNDYLGGGTDSITELQIKTMGMYTDEYGVTAPSSFHSMTNKYTNVVELINRGGHPNGIASFANPADDFMTWQLGGSYSAHRFHYRVRTLGLNTLDTSAMVTANGGTFSENAIRIVAVRQYK